MSAKPMAAELNSNLQGSLQSKIQRERVHDILSFLEDKIIPAAQSLLLFHVIFSKINSITTLQVKM